VKQAEVVKYKPYRLVWMQDRGRQELNGAVVEVVKIIKGPPKKPFVDYNGMPHGAGHGPKRYLLNIGIKVNAANLQEIKMQTYVPPEEEVQ
jgi:hypothetical protein